MSIKEAIKRITWRVTKGGWKTSIDGKDTDAINALIRFVNDKNTEQIKNNELTAKLYILAFGNALKNSGSTVFSGVFQKDFHKQFDRELSFFIQGFQNDLNISEQYEYQQKNNLGEGHPALSSLDQDKQDLDVCYASMKNEIESEKFLGQLWKYDVVKNNLLSQFSQFLDDHTQWNKIY